MQSVQVIIERLKTHPEDFFGDTDGGRILRHAPKFDDIRQKLDNLLTENQDGQVHRLWYLEPEEKAALLDAYKEARRARFEAQVFHTLLTNQEPEEYPTTAVRQHPQSGKFLMQGLQGAMWGGAVPKEEGAKIVGQINQAFEEEYAKNRNT